MSSGIRRLTGSDIPACLKLAVDRGWPAEEERWRLLLNVGEGYGWAGADGALTGAVVLTPYGTAAAVVGLMLVASQHAGQGIGRALMEHLLDRADGHDSVFLFATPAGRPLYEKFGFQHVHDVAKHMGTFTPPHPDPSVRTGPLPPGALERIEALDARALGYDRSRLLRRLTGFTERIRVAYGAEGRITGYGAAWHNAGCTAVGPVIAPDAATARTLVTDLAGTARGPVRLECPVTGNGSWRAWAEDHGLREVDRTAFMVLGEPLPDRSGQHVTPFMQSLG
ncbi:GNAT family N-acetyltransferase [Streptomyces sp. NPDC047046]|uniref:GNAT family N-acetyltransferase n=1 Tax=Streptomyces sp. NPDC047046 TaxID=3155378 RepID=UPI0033C6043D